MCLILNSYESGYVEVESRFIAIIKTLHGMERNERNIYEIVYMHVIL